MNLPSIKQLQVSFDQMQRDHPLGSIAARYVDQALKKHPPPNFEEKKRPRKRRVKHRRGSRDFSDSSMGFSDGSAID